MKVLLIQEQTFLTTALRISLQKKGYELIVCNDRGCPSNAIEAYNPNIIIADISRGRGLNYVEEGRNKNVPVLVICNNTSEEFLKKAFDKGADDYLNIPFSSTELMFRLNSLSNRTVFT